MALIQHFLGSLCFCFAALQYCGRVFCNASDLSENDKYEEMVVLEGGPYWKGDDDKQARDGTYPPTQTSVKKFKINKYPVTNYSFRKFVKDKKFVTTAEEYAWSFVFESDVPEKIKSEITDKLPIMSSSEGPTSPTSRSTTLGGDPAGEMQTDFDMESLPADLPPDSSSTAEPPRKSLKRPYKKGGPSKNAEWWLPVPKAYWKHPEGEGSNINTRLNWPAVHISHIDATAYCKWKGLRLPTEDEWEFAVRGTLIRKKYPWGDKYEKNRMNIWQGKFPGQNKATDGYKTVSPVDAFPPQNDYGLYDMLGNIWEWTSTAYSSGEQKTKQYTLRGGSFIDSKDGSFNHKARNAVRMGNEADAGSNNLGFRCAADVKDSDKDEL